MEFIDPLINQIKAKLEGRIDFVGQERVEQLSRQILWSTGLVAFVVGLALQSLRTTFIILGAGTVATAVTVLPSWPVYNQNKIDWLPELTDDGQLKTESISEETKKAR